MIEPPSLGPPTTSEIVRLAVERYRRRLSEGHLPYQPPQPKKPAGPLCQGLHDLLRERLGPVAVGNRGRARFVRRKFREVLATEPGEFLRTNCPFCGDTRQQLAVSFAWDGTDGRDAEQLGLPVRCWAEDCMADEVNRQKLAELVFGGLSPEQRRQALVCRPGCKVALNVRYFRRRPGPGKVIPLRRLPPGHPALAFLDGLGFDAVALGKEWGVTLCVRSNDHPAAEGRLIVPVTADGVQAGWLALHVGERDWKGGRVPRYYTPAFLPADWTLYNLDAAGRCPVVIVCAEPIDVWAVGPAGVAPLRPAMSPHQVYELKKLALQRQVVFLQTAGNADEVARVCQGFTSPIQEYHAPTQRSVSWQPRRPVVVRLPDGHSTDDLSTKELWDLIRTQAAQQGVAL